MLTRQLIGHGVNFTGNEFNLSCVCKADIVMVKQGGGSTIGTFKNFVFKKVGLDFGTQIQQKESN